MLCTMTFSKTSKNIKELIFHKIIKLIVNDSFKHLGHMGQKTNWSVIPLVHTIHFLKNWSHFSMFILLGKVPDRIIKLMGLLLKYTLGWDEFIFFLPSIMSCAVLLRSGLKIIFHWTRSLYWYHLQKYERPEPQKIYLSPKNILQLFLRSFV